MAFGADTVRGALETALAAVTPAVATLYENRKYDPVPGTPYQECNILFADPTNVEMNRTYFENGYMQVMLRYPFGVGMGLVTARAMLLRNYFYYGLSIALNGATVTVNRTPTIGNGIIDGDRVAVPVKIRFKAQAT